MLAGVWVAQDAVLEGIDPADPDRWVMTTCENATRTGLPDPLTLVASPSRALAVNSSNDRSFGSFRIDSGVGSWPDIKVTPCA